MDALARDRILDTYFWCLVVYSFGSVGWLMLKYRAHINPTTIRAAALERKRLEPEIDAHWKRDAAILSRISIGPWALWGVLMFAL